MALWVTVQGFVDREYLEASVLNRPIRQLRERTDYLFNRLETLADSDVLSSLRLVDVPLATDTEYVPNVKDFVYLNPSTHVYEKALAAIDVANNLLFETDYTGYSLGLLVEKSDDNTTGTVVIMGKVALSDISNWTLTDLLETGETFRSGPYFLSGTARGKMTQYPTGPEIYLGYFTDDVSAAGTGGYAVLSPQFRSFAEAHIHQSFALKMQAAGSQGKTLPGMADESSGSGSGVGPLSLHILSLINELAAEINGFASEAADANYHGTHTGGSAATLTDGAAAFPVNNYVGLRIYNVTRDAVGVITANTATDITAVMETVDGVLTNWETDDQYYIEDRQRLMVIGDYTSSEAVTYTCTLTDATGLLPPTSMSDLYITYTSTDPEDNGIVQIPGYNYPVTLGNKGLAVYLVRTGGTGWSTIDESDNVDVLRRQYVFTAPTQTEGWVPNTVQELMAHHVTTDRRYTLYVTGGPTETTADNTINATVRVAPWCKIVYSGVPVDGDTIDIVGNTYEFDDDGVVSAGNTRVGIVSGDADATYAELLSTLLDAELTGVTPVYHPDGSAFVILRDTGVAGAVTVSVTDTVVTTGLTPGVLVNLTDACFVVYDDYNYSLVDGVNPLVAVGAAYNAVPLKQNLYLRVTPFDTDGTAETTHTANAGDYWTVELNNEAPGASYKYNLGMNTALSALFPPVPVKAAAFVLDGLELASYAHFPDNADYRIGNSGLYWYADMLPWYAVGSVGALRGIHGSQAVTVGSYIIKVQGLGLSETPARVVARIRKPSETMLDVDGSVLTDTVSKDGFTFELTGAALEAGYYLDYLILVNATDTKRGVLHLVRPRAGESGIVRSLQPAPDAPISITRCGTSEAATTGDLQIGVDLSLRSRNDNLTDYNVFKRVQGNRLLAGPVVSRLLPGPGYTVASPPGAPAGCGDVQIQLDSAGMAGDFSEIALQNAKHELIGLFPYVRLLGWTTGGSNVPSGFTAMFSLPSSFTGAYQFVVSMVMFGEDGIASGERRIAGLSYTYSVLHDYLPEGDTIHNLVNGLITPATSPIAWEIPIGNESNTPVYTAYDPMIVHTDPDMAADDQGRVYQASVGPYPKANDLLGGVVEADLNNLILYGGSQVAIQIQRAGITAGTEYTGALGILNLRWRLIPVE